MKNFISFAATVLALSYNVLANQQPHQDQTYNCEGTNNQCYGGDPKNSGSVPVTGNTGNPNVAARSIASLFARYAAAPMTVNDYANAIKSGQKLPAQVEAAAKSQGWVPPKGQKHAKRIPQKPIPHAEAAAHVASGQPIPAPILNAAKAAGWTHPTLAPATGGVSNSAVAVSKSSGKAGKGGKPKARRDAEATYSIEFAERDAEPETDYSDVIHLFERDAFDEDDSLFARDAEPEAFFDDEPLERRALTQSQVQAIIDRMEKDPAAEETVRQALATDPEAEKFAEGLVDQWNLGSGKRDAYPEAEFESEGSAWWF